MNEKGLIGSLEEASKKADELPTWAKEIVANLDDAYGSSTSRPVAQTRRDGSLVQDRDFAQSDSA
jgi:hypothetical protein